jgi:IclR helix-turn-helix domain
MSLRKAGVTAAVASGGDRVLVELSATQVNDVIRAAADAGHVALLLSSLEDVKVALMAGFGELEDPRLSRSLLQGLLVLACFPLDGSYIGNVDVARMLDLHLSTTHRYISTLTAVGLLERDPDARKYRLGRLEAP